MSTAVVGPPEEQAVEPSQAVPVDIVGCSVLSPAGTGLAALASALANIRPDEGTEDLPPLAVRPVAGFDAAAVLGSKGLSRLTRTDRLAMSACTTALAEAGAGPAPERTGVVLGTALGSSGAQSEFLRDTFVQDLPYLVNPSAFPGTLMNSAAGKTAIKHGLTGVNATVSGGPPAALHALRYARTALADGRADRLLAGGVEEVSPQSAHAWRLGGALRPGTPLAEGCAVFALQLADPAAESAPDPYARSTGRRPLGRLLACETGYADPFQDVLGVARRLASCVRTALARSGLAPEDVAVVATGAGGRRGWAAVEERALRSVFPAPGAPSASAAPATPRRLRVDLALGETYGASAALQLAAVLAHWQDPATHTTHPHGDRVAVLTSVGMDGCVGCLVAVRA
ncbi:beta-ketoacyl synthase N-terminal-like domain-containing protein [Streptomyces sp. NPDC057654]|uniref:beta-ketoacyl synthase N-terminal-like domain-containing protein n=1 Tax=Streptomyces sp. NPDC057654 TaxID=3346196 RepID=UPI0036992FF9